MPAPPPAPEASVNRELCPSLPDVPASEEGISGHTVAAVFSFHQSSWSVQFEGAGAVLMPYDDAATQILADIARLQLPGALMDFFDVRTRADECFLICSVSFLLFGPTSVVDTFLFVRQKTGMSCGFLAGQPSISNLVLRMYSYIFFMSIQILSCFTPSA